MSFDWNVFAAESSVPVVALRDDGTLVFVNRATAKLVGRGLLAIENGGMAILLPPRLHPSNADWVGRLLELRQGETGLHLPLCHAGGAEIEVEWSLLPGHDAAGRSVVVLVFHQRKGQFQGKSQGTSREQLFGAIFDHAPVAIFHTDARGVITACNDRFVTLIGSTRQQLIGLNTMTLPNRTIVATIGEALHGKRASYDGEYISVTGNKKSFVRVVCEPIATSDRVEGCVGLVEDVTEQRRAEEVTRRAERLVSLGTLAAGVVHEVQNPLSFVSASLDFALRQLESPGELPRQELGAALTNAREGTSRVAAIVRELKMFSQSDEAKRGPTDVVGAIQAALLLVQGQLAERAALDLDLEPTPPVLASEPRLVQLFANLLLNAAQAIPEGAPRENHVRVSTRVDGDRARIEIEDTGRGIAPEDAGRIFEPFWTDRPSAMGLGLSTCHGIVAAVGGEIFVEQGRPSTSRGTKLVVLLPFERAEPGASASQSPRPERTSEPRARGRVLIVDDEERLAMTLRLALTHAHDVDVATRGKQALERLLQDDADYDVVLCDLMLPDLSGVDVFMEATRKKPELAERFVFLTGGAFQDRARDFLQSVPNTRLDKPFDLDTLERLIAERVARSTRAGS